MTTFSSFNLPSSLSKSLKAMNYENPTEIQARAIPVCLSGKDLLASAQTGTGKTGAFAIPLVAKLLEDPSRKALILTPTRELAEQIFQVVLQMIKGERQLGLALLIGGVPIFKQFSKLRNNPQIIIGTPGRVYDHINRGKTAGKHQAKLDVSDFDLLILDEADRMLDMGFGEQLDAIVKEMPSERQTMMFSATFPKGIKQISQRYLREPERIDVGVKHQLSTNLTHESVFIDGKAKFGKLVEVLDGNEGTIIVFANTKRMCDQLSDMLFHEKGIRAIAMHGDLKQSQRTRVISGFRDKRYRVLVATDVAARGLDIPHVEMVINYDLPMSPEDYIHRVGRTARAGAKGHALDLVSSVDKSKLSVIKRLLKGEDMDFDRQMPARRGNPQQRRGGSFKGEPRRSGEYRRDDSRRGEFRRDESRRDDTRRSEFRRDDSRSSGFRRDESRRDDSRSSGFRRDESRRDDSRSNGFRRDESRSSGFRRDETRRDDSRPSGFRRDETRRDDSRPSGFRRDESRTSEFRKDDSSQKRRGPQSAFSKDKQGGFQNRPGKPSPYKKGNGAGTGFKKGPGEKRNTLSAKKPKRKAFPDSDFFADLL